MTMIAIQLLRKEENLETVIISERKREKKHAEVFFHVPHFLVFYVFRG